MAAGGVGKEVKGRTHTYYQVGFRTRYQQIFLHFPFQVLIDGRDSPYITHRSCHISMIDAKNSYFRAQTESVTFLGNHSENTKYLHGGQLTTFSYLFLLGICMQSLVSTMWLTKTSFPIKPTKLTPFRLIIPTKLSLIEDQITPTPSALLV